MKLILLFATFIFLVVAAGNPVFSQEKARLNIADTGHTIISRNIYGTFAEHLGRGVYDGIYYQGRIRQNIVAALKRIKIANLRWPGGCFADQYHWRDGIGDKAKRSQTVNTTWGMVTEDNSFGTAEFMQLCREIGCEPYIAGNVGTGIPEEMKDWIEYLNFGGQSTLAAERKANGQAAPYKVKLWGVGNESWGCGGNMTPEYYASLYRHFAAFCPDYPGAPLQKIASGANADDYHWTEVLMKNIPAEEMYGISLHYYTFPTGYWLPRGSATHFSEQEYAHSLEEALRMEELITRHSAIMDKYDPGTKVALMVDEWGVWNDPEPGTKPAFNYQQSSLRDALIAASTLNIFNNHADRVKGANLAQAVNVIHALILTKGSQMLLTPTYYVFDLYKVHQDARLLPLRLESPLYIKGKDTVKAVNASASIDSNQTIHISLVNLNPNQAITVVVKLPANPGKTISGQLLTSDKVTDINTFEYPDLIHLVAFHQASLNNDKLTVTLPAKSVVMLEIKR